VKPSRVLVALGAVALMLGTVGAGTAQADYICASSQPGFALDATAPANTIATSFGRRDTFTWWSDLVTVDVSAPPFPLGQNQVLVRFGTRTAWDKEVVARDLCWGDVGSLYARGNSTNPSTLLVQEVTSPGNGAHTLVLRKQGFFWIWIDSASFSNFFTAYGGQSITITWWSD
jgi:hypothetical protein